MATYYVHIPNSEKAPTAEVEATSTKHARTVYLDYLSRNNLITWGDRQRIRTFIKVSRMQPGETQTQIKLVYNTPEPPVKEVPSPEEAQVPTEEVEEVEQAGTKQPQQPQSVATVPSPLPAQTNLPPPTMRRVPPINLPVDRSKLFMVNRKLPPTNMTRVGQLSKQSRGA